MVELLEYQQGVKPGGDESLCAPQAMTLLTWNPVLALKKLGAIH